MDTTDTDHPKERWRARLEAALADTGADEDLEPGGWRESVLAEIRRRRALGAARSAGAQRRYQAWLTWWSRWLWVPCLAATIAVSYAVASSPAAATHPWLAVGEVVAAALAVMVAALVVDWLGERMLRALWLRAEEQRWWSPRRDR